MAKFDCHPVQPESLDQRTELVRQLSEVVDVQELDSTGANDTYVLSLAGSGQTLVVNADAQQLTAGNDAIAIVFTAPSGDYEHDREPP